MNNYTATITTSIFPSPTDFKASIEPHYNQALVFATLVFGCVVLVLIIKSFGGK